jgi:hypothetical protein
VRRRRRREMSLSTNRLFVEESQDDPEAIDVYMDGEVIMTVTYDEVGYSGQEAIRRLVELISFNL